MRGYHSKMARIFFAPSNWGEIVRFSLISAGCCAGWTRPPGLWQGPESFSMSHFHPWWMSLKSFNVFIGLETTPKNNKFLSKAYYTSGYEATYYRIEFLISLISKYFDIFKRKGPNFAAAVFPLAYFENH